jgi:uncharacterized protein
VIDRVYTRSLLLDTEGHRGFSTAPSRDLDAPAIESPLLEPESCCWARARITFPPRPFLPIPQASRRSQAMDNAAARTFNVLIGEGRRAVAVFLLPG